MGSDYEKVLAHCTVSITSLYSLHLFSNFPNIAISCRCMLHQRVNIYFTLFCSVSKIEGGQCVRLHIYNT